MGFLSSVGKIAGTITGSTAAGEASEAANRAGWASQEKMFEKSSELYKPWREAGLRGLTQYEDLLKDPSSVTGTPGYQFGMQQGLQGLGASASARGMGLSGRTLKDITRFGQDYSSTKFDQHLNRYKGLADYGMQATGATAGIYGQQGTAAQGFHQRQGQIKSAQATAPFQDLMTLGKIGMAAYTGGASMMAPGGMPGGGGAGSIDPRATAGW